MLTATVHPTIYTVVYPVIYLAFQSTSLSSNQFIELAKIIIPALLAYLLSRMQAQREQKKAEIVIAQKTQDQLDAKEGRLNVAWEGLTVQVRDLLTKAYETADRESEARRLAEAAATEARTRAFTLETEKATLQRQLSEALEELEELRRKVRRRVTRDDKES